MTEMLQIIALLYGVSNLGLLTGVFVRMGRLLEIGKGHEKRLDVVEQKVDQNAVLAQELKSGKLSRII